ncbi:pyridoxal-phosphate dependent enzyme [Arthrobacter sp. NPDC056886]|uniref:pyridoxal-phosphate dependent enzyme n=1 Tax=Arthrobacter sp. NPDC056886 TaxID=3345960 RepID=UPI00366E294D
MISTASPNYVCFDCKTVLDPAADCILCACGGVLDLPPLAPKPRASLDDRPPVPRFWAADWAIAMAGLGEGTTPLIRWDDGSNVWLKCDHLLPTGSFKDRGAKSVVARAVELGAKEVVVDSSGNAGAALGAHAARAGLDCTIFVPSKTSAGKVAQIRGYGAAVRLVAGPREMCERAALSHAFSVGAFYAGHSTNPYFHDGTKSWFYEIVAQLPSVDTVVLPVGSGSLLLGLLRAVDELVESGWIKQAPRLVIAQTLGYESLASGGSTLRGSVDPLEYPIAEGIALRHPTRRAQMRERLARLEVTVCVVDSDEVLLARRELGYGGFYVEPTSAVAWAAWRRTNSPGTSVVALTGNGLKVGG